MPSEGLALAGPSDDSTVKASPSQYRSRNDTPVKPPRWEEKEQAGQ